MSNNHNKKAGWLEVGLLGGIALFSYWGYSRKKREMEGLVDQMITQDPRLVAPVLEDLVYQMDEFTWEIFRDALSSKAKANDWNAKALLGRATRIRDVRDTLASNKRRSYS